MRRPRRSLPVSELDALRSDAFAGALVASGPELISYRELGAMLARDSTGGQTRSP